MPRIIQRLMPRSNPFKLLLQYLLPHHLVTRLVGWAAHRRFRPWVRALIRVYARVYRVDLGEAATSDIERYPTFNAFFVRPLHAGARPMPEEPDAVACPADGTVSALGSLDGGRLLQAKGCHYDAAALLGDARLAAPFEDGDFITIYLSPRDYHRVHVPMDAELRDTSHVPGRLFSVAPFTVRGVPGLFCQNERLACVFGTASGAMAQVLVGAMVVAGIETTWHGGYGHPARASRESFQPGQVKLARGAEMARFNMGSTVILLFEPGRIRWRDGLLAGDRVTMGQSIGSRLSGAAEPAQRH